MMMAGDGETKQETRETQKHVKLSDKVGELH
jgi:hypothetical protein